MFKDNEEQEPYIRMVIPSEYPNGIIVAKHPTTLKVNTLKLVCLSIGLLGGGGGVARRIWIGRTLLHYSVIVSIMINILIFSVINLVIVHTCMIHR